MREALVKKELKCFCARKPLLAMYGVDRDHKLFVHVKIWKQSRVYGEIVVTEGNVKILCRECLRWHEIIIRQPDTMALKEVETPDAVAGVAAPTCLPIAPSSN